MVNFSWSRCGPYIRDALYLQMATVRSTRLSNQAERPTNQLIETTEPYVVEAFDGRGTNEFVTRVAAL